MVEVYQRQVESQEEGPLPLTQASSVPHPGLLGVVRVWSPKGVALVSKEFVLLQVQGL